MTILDTIQRYRDQLDTLVTGQPNPRAISDRPLADQLALFEEIAQGKIDRAQANQAFVAEVEDALDQLLLILCTPPDVHAPTLDVLPRDIWTRSETGRLLSYVAWWLYQDDLIAVSDAASLLYDVAENTEIVRIYRRIERGELNSYIDPRETNPQYARRVRRSQVAALQERSSQEIPKAPPLPKDQVDIVKLHDEEGKSFQAIGDLMGVTRQAAHHMYQTRKKGNPKK
jgi:hypothetical protein